ncbi:Mu transposase C-terminal domain-containing protein [Legionella bozemanae]|uniref:Transposon Tn7 transposition protein TnsB n=1 Tax=Legionella bozemanae TaxID=447 RepID=A0A0W0RF01_LEGBO|nr:Mu transposase C-terminal domain-containing protein [Legionella bozemanae]KTC69547.1 Transposon Tn7 transposition protein TnsB [Legionella bozemanae]STP10055.1 Transposon Tn7 transposition protein tnsB [Legionella bozemanae]
MTKKNAIYKFKIIQPYLDNISTLTFISEDKEIPIRSLHRWVNQYKNNGLKGLEQKRWRDKGQYRQLSDNLVNIIEGLVLQKQKRTVASIHRQILLYAQDHKLPKPSYGVVAKIIKNIPPDLICLARDGTKSYQQKFDLLYIREADRPNQIWQADHTLLDIYVHDGKGELKRPWLTIIIDDYSRAISGYYLSFNAPTAQQTALALRQAIWKKSESNWPICGVPEILYTDHGSDFTSKHIEEVCASLKIQLIFSGIGKPRGRGKVERFFGTINQQFLQDLPGYLQNGIMTQKDKCFTLEIFESKLKAFILSDYNHSVHSTTKIPPVQHWQANQFLPQLPKSQEVLDLLLLTITKPRKVHREGIKFQGLRYFSTTLAGFIGQEVLIRYDPRDMAEIYVFYQGKFLCRAISQDLDSGTTSLKEIIAARSQRKKELRDNIKKRQSLVDAILQCPGKIPGTLPKESINKPEKQKNITIKRYQYE